MKFRIGLLLGLGLLFLFSANTYGNKLRGAFFPSLLSSLEFPSPLTLCEENVPLEVQEIKERLEKELLLSLWDRPQVILWLKRSSRYFPYIEKLLQKHNMPPDLKYLAVAESALRPHARSSKGATGFWQFMRATGRKFGLAINSYIDERRSIFASTEAAIKYLKDLHDMFGSWTLAVAAYNVGENSIKAEIQEQGTNDYYRLHLPLETQRFIFRIISIKLVCENPERYGFCMPKHQYYPPLEFDRVKIKCPCNIPIRIIAGAANTYFKAIKDLNPEIRGHHLPRGNHFILVPKGSSKGFGKRYEKLSKKWLGSEREGLYVVKRGDNLLSIAKRFNVSLSSILSWNDLKLEETIYPGERLIIYGSGASGER